MYRLKDTPQADAALLFVSGQSNASAHNQPLPEQERITRPLANVWALDRAENQNFTSDRVTWSGYTDAGKNLGETQDGTGTISHYIAAAWQQAVDAGAALPDLYIVHISVGSQGILRGKWKMDWPAVAVPGDHLGCNIGLYKLALRTLTMAVADLKARFAHPAVIGWHWLGSESDSDWGAWDATDFRQQYDRFFDTQLAAIELPCRVWFYKLVYQYAEPVCGAPDTYRMEFVNAEFRRQIRRLGNAELVPTDESPLWDAADPHRGVFCGDGVHYRRQTQAWFARRFLEEITV